MIGCGSALRVCTMSSPYDQIADYYDLVHADVTVDIPFYVGLAQDFALDRTILELGCGSGRTLVPLAAAGLQVVGLDHSRAMLDRARQRLQAEASLDRATLVQGDMADLNLGRSFTLIIVPLHTWMHLTTTEAQLASLRCIEQHLQPGGHLIIDLPAPLTIVDAEHDGSLTLENTFVDPQTGDQVLQLASTRLDQEQQTLHVTWVYDRVGPDQVVRRTVAPMVLRLVYPHQVELMLQECGLALAALWGDYDRSPFRRTSEKLIIHALKPGR